MNISFNAQNPYTPYMQKAAQNGAGSLRANALSASLPPETERTNTAARGFFENAGQTESGKSALSKQMKQLLRDLHKTPEKPQNPFAGTPQDGVNGIFDPSGAQEEKEDETWKRKNCL